MQAHPFICESSGCLRYCDGAGRDETELYGHPAPLQSKNWVLCEIPHGVKWLEMTLL